MSKSTSDLFRKAVLVAIGATAVTAEKINDIVDELVVKGEMSENQANELKKDIKEKAVKEKEAFESKVSDSMQSVVSRVVKDMGLATKTDLEELEKRILSKIEGHNENPPTEDAPQEHTDG